MTRALAPESDPFRGMLVWSGVLHVAVFLSLIVAARASQPASVLPTPTVAWIVPGSPGPGAAGGGSPPAPKPPEKTESSEPKKDEPRVVRPTKEDRKELPMPDAKPGKPKKDQTSSGLVGKDAASAPSARLSPGTGISGLGLGGTGGGSAFDQDFEYSYYVNQMLTRINVHWQRIPVRGQTVVIVAFTILKDGHLADIRVEQTSGISMLDRAAERAIFLSDPLPPLPNSYPRDRVGVHLQFVYSEQNGL